MERELPKQLLVTPAQGVVQHIATQLQNTAPRHPSPRCTTHCNALQHNCDTLQHTASRHPSTRCATRCNALQHLHPHLSVKRDLPRVKRDLDIVNYKNWDYTWAVVLQCAALQTSTRTHAHIYSCRSPAHLLQQDQRGPCELCRRQWRFRGAHIPTGEQLSRKMNSTSCGAAPTQLHVQPTAHACANSYVWHDAYICDMTHPYVRLTAHSCVILEWSSIHLWLIHVCRIHMWHDLFVRDTNPSRMQPSAHPCVTGRIHMGHDPLICVTCSSLYSPLQHVFVSMQA